MIPWGLERHYRRTGDLDFVAARWPIVERAAAVCVGASGHPGLRWLDDLSLISSAGIWDSRFGAFLYSNAAVVAGLRSAARLARLLDRDEPAAAWDERWPTGSGTRASCRESAADGDGPGLVDHETGRFLEGRRLSTLRGFWTDRPERT